MNMLDLADIDEEIKRVSLEVKLLQDEREKKCDSQNKEFEELRLKLEKAKEGIDFHLKIEKVGYTGRKELEAEAFEMQLCSALQLLNTIQKHKRLLKIQRKKLFDELENTLTLEIEKATLVEVDLLNKLHLLHAEMISQSEQMEQARWKSQRNFWKGCADTGIQNSLSHNSYFDELDDIDLAVTKSDWLPTSKGRKFHLGKAANSAETASREYLSSFKNSIVLNASSAQAC